MICSGIWMWMTQWLVRKSRELEVQVPIPSLDYIFLLKYKKSVIYANRKCNHKWFLKWKSRFHLPRIPVLFFVPSLSLPDLLCDPTDLILRKETPFKAMTSRTAPSLDGLLAQVFRGFPQQMPGDLCTARGIISLRTLIICDRRD